MALVPLLLVVLLSGGFEDARAAGPGLTAKARLDEARAAAARWQPDAALVSLTALRVGDDGTAAPGVTGWVYTFHAKKAGKWAGFHAGAAGLERVDLPAGFTAPLPVDFVDSDRVLAEVGRNGFRRSGDTLATLLLQADPALRTGVYWCVAGAADISLEQGMRGWCVDPATGKFAARLAGQAAAPPARQAPPAEARSLSVDLPRCGGFGAESAAAVLGVPAAKVAATIRATGPGTGSCSFAAPGGAALAFDIAVRRSAGEAGAEMERRRKSLQDDYSDIVGVGDDGLWTDTDKIFTARKGNITVRVTQPADKMKQIRAAKAFLDGI